MIIPKDYNDVYSKDTWDYLAFYSNIIRLDNSCYRPNSIIRKATTEEEVFFHSKLAEAGYKYNAETHKVEKWRWKPEYEEFYYTPLLENGYFQWTEDDIDTYAFKMNAVFKTKAESDEALEKIKQVLANN